MQYRATHPCSKMHHKSINSHAEHYYAYSATCTCGHFVQPLYHRQQSAGIGGNVPGSKDAQLHTSGHRQTPAQGYWQCQHQQTAVRMIAANLCHVGGPGYWGAVATAGHGRCNAARDMLAVGPLEAGAGCRHYKHFHYKVVHVYTCTNKHIHVHTCMHTHPHTQLLEDFNGVAVHEQKEMHKNLQQHCLHSKY